MPRSTSTTNGVSSSVGSSTDHAGDVSASHPSAAAAASVSSPSHHPGGTGSTNRNVAIAAGLASFMTKSLLHPIDTVKCRMQSSPQVGGPRAYIARWAGQWSPRYLYAGLSAKLVMYVPFQGVYMTTYQATKREVSNKFGWEEKSWRTVVVASLTADFASAIIRVPMEAVKMRQQSVVYRGLSDGLRQLYQQGRKPLFRLVVPQTFLHDIPYSFVQWLLYETLKPWIEARIPALFFGSATSHAGAFLAGATTGVVAGLVTTPLDVVKTRVVVLRATDADATISREVQWLIKGRGVRGLMTGASMRALWISTNLGIYLTLFEAFRKYDWKALAQRKAPPAGHSLVEAK